MKYNAFISYSHTGDAVVAPALGGACNGSPAGGTTAAALKVFRDETGLSASPALWGSIRSALGRG